MRKYWKIAVTVTAVITWITNLLPIMSSHLSGGESCTLMVRGYNLMEFSAWGCIPMLVPLLVLMVLLSDLTKAAKEVGLMCLLTANLISYTHACNAARAWLEAEGELFLTYYPGMLLIPLVAVGAIVLAFVACQDRVQRRGNDFWDFRESAKQQGNGDQAAGTQIPRE